MFIQEPEAVPLEQEVSMWPNKKKLSEWSPGIPNKFRDKPTIAFHSKLSPEAKAHLNALSRLGKKSQYINDAIEMKVWHDKHPKGFLLNMIQNNFTLCKYLVRKIGRTMSQNSVTKR